MGLKARKVTGGRGASGFDLDATVRDLIAAYGEHTVTTATVSARPFEVASRGAEIVLAVEVDGNVVELVGQISGFRSLAARYWALGLPPSQRTIATAFLPTLLSFHGSVVEAMSALLEDARVVRGLAAAAPHYAAMGLADEATCCRLALSLLDFPARSGPAGEAVRAARKKRRLNMLRLIKMSLPFVDADELELRLCGLAELTNAMIESPGRVTPIHRLFEKHVVPRCEDSCALVQELAISILEPWVGQLISRAAYAEALTVLDRLLAFGVTVPRNLLRRYTCRLVTGDEAGAEHDIRAAEALADSSGRFIIQAHHIQSITFLDFKAMALHDAAIALLKLADGKPTCAETRVDAAFKARLRPPAEYRARARALSSAARDLIARRVRERPPEEGYGYWDIALERVENVLRTQ